MTKNKRKLITKILERTLMIIGVVALLGVGLYVFARVDWIDDSKFGASKAVATPTPSPSPMPTTKSQVQYKSTTQTNTGLSLEDRQKLGAKRAELEEAIRKNEESKQKLYSSLNTLLAQCQKASGYDKQCWDEYYKFQEEVNQAVKDIDQKNATARQGISEINAILGN
ncbi:MAG TPA: hypothetical protein VF185_04785 [Patescibacteria group bacterium]